MNLETFKARARRKLELAYNSRSKTDESSLDESDEAIARPPIEPASREPASRSPEKQASNRVDNKLLMDPPSKKNAATVVSPAALYEDKFANAKTPAQPEVASQVESQKKTEPFTAPMTSNPSINKPSINKPSINKPAAANTHEAPTEIDPRTERRVGTSVQNPVQNITGSPAGKESESRSDVSSEEQLQHLRSMLIGNSHDDQQDQVDAAYQRTKADIGDLRGDMEARLTSLTKYVEQLEQSILNSLESRTQTSAAGGLGADTESRLAQQDQRLDALEALLTNTLDNLQGDFDDHRQADRRFFRQELASVNDRTDELLAGVGQRLESSIDGVQNNISAQLSDHSTGLNASTESATIESLREELNSLVDQRIETFDTEQSQRRTQLRDDMFATTDEIRLELRAQREEKHGTLDGHRKELERQFSTAIANLNTTKVSHDELSLVLSRLADRLQKL